MNRFPVAAWAVGLILPASAAAQARPDAVAGVEIGAKGVKAVVLDLTPVAGGGDPVVKYTDATNVGLVAEVARTGRFDPKVAAAAAAVGRYAVAARDKYGVPADRVFVVGSSGLFGPIEDKPDAVAANRTALAAAVEAAAGRPVEFLTAKREAELSVAGTVPVADRDAGVLIDIGSGNTKGGAAAAGGYELFAVPFGTAALSEQAKKVGGPMPAAARNVRDQVVGPAVKAALGGAGGLAARPKVYLSGGVVWAVATIARPADRSAYIKLTRADIDAVEAKLAADPTKLPAPDLDGVSAADAGPAAAEFAKVKAAFTPDQLLAGVQILKAVADELAAAGPPKSFAFVRRGAYAWLVTYVGTPPRP